MLIFTKTAELRAHLNNLKQEGHTLGFVPTMGALHPGHLSLISASKKECNITICSIFVNPTQFNDKSDLEKYPRMPEKDAEMLEKAFCDILFMPTVDEMYSNEKTPSFDFGHLDTILEGKHRPGHFNGVAQVVKRFFEIIEPTKAYFGSKDYQQVMIIKALLRQLQLPIEVIACPIIREPDGLAMSSRNSLLRAEERKLASLIPKLMEEAKQIVLSKGISAAKTFVLDNVVNYPSMKLDYYEVCDAETLQIASEGQMQNKKIALIALFVGKIRLIDNLPFY